MSETREPGPFRDGERAKGDIARGGDGALCALRIPKRPTCVLCAVCGVKVLVAGPTGFQGDEPTCDACLLELSPELGMVLLLVAVARMFGALRIRDAEHQVQALLELGAFVRLFERYASRRAPTRGLGSFLR